MTQEDSTNSNKKSSDFLVTAFEFQLGPPLPLDTPDDWEQRDENVWSGYDWNFSECGTPHPTPRQDYATLFVKYRTNQEKKNHVIIRGHSEQDDQDQMEDDDDRIRIYRSSPQQQEYFLRGVAYPQEDLVNIQNVHDMSTEPDPATNDDSSDTSTWTMGVFHVATKKDYEFACELAKENPKHRTVLKHEQTSHVVEKNKQPSSSYQDVSSSQQEESIMLCITTGMRPDDASTLPGSSRFWYQRLSTRIELKTTSSTTIAKCHISYRDDQWDPWIGPCIEAMSVNPLYRNDNDDNGKGWLWVLWYQGVVPFLRQNYAMVHDSSDDDDNNASIQVRVIHLLGSELDRRRNVQKDGNTSTIRIWDKDFYFGQVGFSILPRGLRTGVMNYMRPQDDQGIGYISISTTNATETTDDKDTSPANNDSSSYPCYIPQVGARYCQTCGKISKQCFGCNKDCGGRVYYCSTACQEQDAPQHERWCGLTRQQVHEALVQEGRRVQDSKGEWRTLL